LTSAKHVGKLYGTHKKPKKQTKKTTGTAGPVK